MHPDVSSELVLEILRIHPEILKNMVQQKIQNDATIIKNGAIDIKPAMQSVKMVEKTIALPGSRGL